MVMGSYRGAVGSGGHVATDRDERIVFHENRRGAWRATWTLAYAFLLVAWLMQRDGTPFWLLFAGVALILLAVGVSALAARRSPLLAVQPDGLRVYAGQRSLGGRGAASEFTIPWAAVDRIGFERRLAARSRGEEHPHTVEVLCVRLAESAARPDGGRGFLERIAGREEAIALGEHFVWNPIERSLDLVGHPRGGYSALTAAIADVEPRLGDASGRRRSGIEGPLAYAAYDASVASAVVGTLWLWTTGNMEVYAEMARALFSWGARVIP